MPSPESSPLNSDFVDLLRALSAAAARHLVVGGYAIGAHAEPRTTGDLDVWIEPTQRNAARVLAALRSFGAPLKDLSVEDLARAGTVFQMGIPPNRIDILTSVSGVSFAAAWRTRIYTRWSGIAVPLIGRSALIRNKKASGRPKDLEDVRRLARFRRQTRTMRSNARGRGKR